MATPVRERTTGAGEEIRILPPEHPGAHRPPASRRPIAWIAAFVVAMLALATVVVVEEMRIADRDDTIAALERDAVRMDARVAAQQLTIRDLRQDLSAALARGTASKTRASGLRADLAASEEQLARMQARETIFTTRAGRFGDQAERLRLALATWMPPVADGSYGGRMLGVSAIADPPRIAFEAIESENAGQWMLLPVAAGVEVTVWSYPAGPSTERTKDLAFLDKMFSTDSPWARFHRRAWYDIVVEGGAVTEIHEAPPKA